MIALENTLRPLRDVIETSFDTFAAEHPNTVWSTFALYACPWAGWIGTCFDTEQKSAAIVAEFEKNGSAWYGQDEWGRFGNNCPDFQFPNWRLLELPDWQSEYEEAEPIHVRDLRGRDHYIGSENEAINGLVFEFLEAAVQKEAAALRQTSPALFRSRRRFGVQLLDSAFVKFWRGPYVDN